MLHTCSPYCPPSCPYSPTYTNKCVNSEDGCSANDTCLQILTSDQVLYTGTNLLNYNIQPGDSLTTIVDKLVAILYPNCFGVFDETFEPTFN